MSDAAPHPNHLFAATFVDELVRSGVRTACVSPGSRSAPLAIALARNPHVRVFVHVDERSGSFFGLGLAKSLGMPVVLLCTSGTAAVEFHPAVVEAFHSQAPLIVLTADRPPELIGVGANQAIDQTRLYGTAVRWFHDPGVPVAGDDRRWRALARRAVDASTRPPGGPVHLNLPFREPLVPAPGETVDTEQDDRPPGKYYSVGHVRPPALDRAFADVRRPLIVAGAMKDALPAGQVARMMPVLAEPTSGARRGPSISSYEALLRVPGWADGRRPDAVIRFGARPTSRTLNEWLAGLEVPHWVVDPDDLRRDPDQVATGFLRYEPRDVLSRLEELETEPAWAAGWHAADAKAREALDHVLAESLHEGAVVRALAACVAAPTNVFLGSSLPVRDADWFWPDGFGVRFLGNRGASGIDGLVSTGLGVAAASADPTVLLLGDLSLYHDMNGLWSVGRHGARATIVLLDNGGGGIFEFLPPAQHRDVFEEMFATPLGLDFGHVAELYGLEHLLVQSVDQLEPALRAALGAERSHLVQVRFSREQSVAGHRAAWAAVAEALS